MVDEDDAWRQIQGAALVTRQMVTLAKGFLQSLSDSALSEVSRLPTRFAQEQGFPRPDVVVLHSTSDLSADILRVAGHIGRALALYEALWSLIHQGYFCTTGQQQAWREVIPWTTIIGGSGTRGTWEFPERELTVPVVLVRAPSVSREQPQPLTA